MDIDIAMQFDNDYGVTEAVKIFNHGALDEKRDEELFCVIEPVKDDEKTESVGGKKLKQPNPWKMKKQVYTKQMIMKKYNLGKHEVPRPVRKSEKFMVQYKQKEAIKASLSNPEKIKKLINKTKWCRIKVFSKLNKKRRKTLFIKQFEFQDDLRKKNAFESQDLELIPIVLFTRTGYNIHHVIILKIDNSNVGISLIYDNSSNSAKVTGIHIDKDMIDIQHQWMSLEHSQECDHDCLNNFVSHIDHVEIGNVDADANRIKDLRGKYDKLEQEYRALLFNWKQPSLDKSTSNDTFDQ